MEEKDNANTWPDDGISAAAPTGIVSGDATKELAYLKLQIEAQEATTKQLKDRFAILSAEVLKTLELAEVDSIKAHGFTFYKETKSSVTTPKTNEEKQQLFEFLQNRGIFLDTVSVNSMTLNALYKSLAEDAAKEGILDYRMPGVGEPTTYTTLKLRRS